MSRLLYAFLLGAVMAPLAARAQSVGYVTLVAASPVDPNNKVPVINGVPGAGISNYDMGFPLTLIPHGQPVVISVLSQNGTFSGTCVTSFSITQKQDGKKKTLLKAKIKTFSCNAGDVWAWVYQTPDVPDDVGAATLTGTVTYGTTKVNLSVPIYIQ